MILGRPTDSGSEWDRATTFSRSTISAGVFRDRDSPEQLSGVSRRSMHDRWAIHASKRNSSHKSRAYALSGDTGITWSAYVQKGVWCIAPSRPQSRAAIWTGSPADSRPIESPCLAWQSVKPRQGPSEIALVCAPGADTCVGLKLIVARVFTFVGYRPLTRASRNIHACPSSSALATSPSLSMMRQIAEFSAVL